MLPGTTNTIPLNISSLYRLYQCVHYVVVAVIGATSQLPATQASPFNGGEELDCAANRSLVVSFVCGSHDFMELNQTLRTHDG